MPICVALRHCFAYASKYIGMGVSSNKSQEIYGLLQSHKSPLQIQRKEYIDYSLCICSTHFYILKLEGTFSFSCVGKPILDFIKCHYICILVRDDSFYLLDSVIKIHLGLFHKNGKMKTSGTTVSTC